MSRRRVAKALAGVKPGTVLDHYTERFGLHRGAVRAAHFVQIAMVMQEHGRDHSASEYARYWSLSPRTAFQHREEAAEVYGENWRDVGGVARERDGSGAYGGAGCCGTAAASRVGLIPAGRRPVVTLLSLPASVRCRGAVLLRCGSRGTP